MLHDQSTVTMFKQDTSLCNHLSDHYKSSKNPVGLFKINFAVSVLCDFQQIVCSTVVSHVGGRPFWMKNFKCIFLVSLASLGAERSGKIDFRTPEAQKTEKMLSQMGSYVHFTV